MSPENSEFDKEYVEQKYNCIVNEERAIEVISAALCEYEHNEKGFFKDKEQAEEKYINFLIEQGEDSEFILNATFLLTTVVFGSSSSIFFKRLSTDPEIYSKYRWLFVPSEVAKSELLIEEMGIKDSDLEFEKSWIEYIRPLGRQKSSLPGWHHNCKVLSENYDGKISEYFKKHNNDAKEIWDALVYKPGGQNGKKEFKRLDRKLSSLFLQWVGRYGLYELNRMDEFGLPVDLQLSKIAIQTGIIEPIGDIYRENLANDVFVPLIKKLCKEFKEYGWTPRLVSEALWLIGSEGCTPDQRAIAPYFTCPISPYCKGVLHKLEKDYWRFSNIEKMGKKFSKWQQDRLL